jgi:hypothetical protein
MRIARVLLQHLPCFFMGHEASAVQVAISPTPRTGDYNFRQVLPCDPRLLSVGEGGGFLRWCMAYLALGAILLGSYGAARVFSPSRF